MEKLGLTRRKISSLILPNDFPSRLKGDDAKAMAQSIKKTMVIHDPLVRVGDDTVVLGVDRIAACRINKEENIQVMMIQCTDKEMDQLRGEENHRRRQYSAAQRKSGLQRLVQVEKSIEAERKKEAKQKPKPLAENKKPATKGRPKGSTGATTKAAKTLGVSPRTARRAVAKTKKKPQLQQRELPPIDRMGFPLTEKREGAIREVVDAFESIDRNLRDAKSMLARIGKLKLPMDPVVLSELEQSLQSSQHLFTRHAPKTICLFCKERSDLVDDCPSCGGSAYSTAMQFDDAPKGLRVTGDKAQVSISGKLRPYGAQ